MVFTHVGETEWFLHVLVGVDSFYYVGETGQFLLMLKGLSVFYSCRSERMIRYKA